MPRTLLAVLCLAVLAVPEADAAQALPVVVVPTLEVSDLDGLSTRGAVGLLVPGAGPETSRDLAWASLVRGEARNSLRDGPPRGRRLIEVEVSGRIPDAPAIVLALPRGGRQPNDRRYPVAVLGSRHAGSLVSERTRLPGLVSIADLAPTALGREDGLRSTPARNPVEELEELDRRIDDNRDVRPVAAFTAAGLVGVLALAVPRAAPAAVVGLLAANVALGAAGVSSFWPALAALLGCGAAVGLTARGPRTAARLAAAAAVLFVAYLVAMGVDAATVALSPLGPTQNARFYGLSNLLETLLLVPALAGAWVAGRRLGLAAFLAVAVLALVTVAGSRFGADGGGAVVLAAGYAVLGAGLFGRRDRRTVLLAVGAAVAAVGGLLAVDAAFGLSTHISRSLEGGPGSLASDLADRVSLSWARATSGWGVGLAVLAGIAALATLVARLPRLRLAAAERTLLASFATAIGVSLVVNDSPLEIAVWGAVGYLALERWCAREALKSAQLEFGRPFRRS